MVLPLDPSLIQYSTERDWSQKNKKGLDEMSQQLATSQASVRNKNALQIFLVFLFVTHQNMPMK
jgi:hypothetical protein